jgi:hypothetical protein
MKTAKSKSEMQKKRNGTSVNMQSAAFWGPFLIFVNILSVRTFWGPFLYCQYPKCENLLGAVPHICQYPKCENLLGALPILSISQV